MKKYLPLIISFIVSCAGYGLLGYHTQRSEFANLLIIYALLFAAYLFMVRNSSAYGMSILFKVAVVFRLLFLISIPALSNDYLRFVWDGEMFNLLHNPYTVIPSTFVRHSNQVNELLERLYTSMNSPDYHTVYPPFAQYTFALAAFIFPNNLTGSLIVLRLFTIAADIGSIFLIRKLLLHFKLPEKNVWWYALNPLVILELSGNVHLEGIMIFFLLLALYLLIVAADQPKIPVRIFILSAMAYAVAISTKLIPLLFLPFLILRLRGKSLIYFGVIAFTIGMLSLPFLDPELISGFSSSIDLYFQKFEFNASLYYLIRWMGFRKKGYNIIHSAGPWLAVAVFFLIVMLFITEKKLTWQHFFRMMQWALTIYLLFATTVHPWYETTLIMLSVFTGFRYAVIWSAMIILSYATYQTSSFTENLWLTALEYGTVLLFLGIELSVFRNKKDGVAMV